MRLLIIDDDENLVKILKLGLEKEGYAVDHAADGKAGLRRIEFNGMDYDIIIVDLMLPGENGFEICRKTRAKGISIPILVLTGRDLLEEKIKLLDAGADDFLAKPFYLSEVSARLRALARRPKQIMPVELAVVGLRLLPATMEVFLKGKLLKLTLKEFRLLEYFMRHKDQVCKRQDITDNIWDFNFDSLSNIVDVYINRLRNKINSAGGNITLETVRGVGYKLNSQQPFGSQK